jgi:hypothetical protein
MSPVLVLVRRLAGICLAALALTAAPAGAANWSCGAKPLADGHTKAVFGHTNTRRDAEALLRRVRLAFKFTEVAQVGCADWIVYLSGLDTPKQQREFALEAVDYRFPGVSYMTSSDLTEPSPPGTVKAVFGTFRTAAAASRMLSRAAAAGFRVIGLARYGPNTFKVVVTDIPLASSQAFAREARSAGLSVAYELG